MNRLDTRDPDFTRQFHALHDWDANLDDQMEGRVREIVHAVRDRGDAALREFTERFDGLSTTSAADLEIPRTALEKALNSLEPLQRAALEEAAQRIRAYHEYQRSESWSFSEANGTRLGQRILPLSRVGIYVPGGKAAYPSSVLMNAIPAHVAGVEEIIMVVPTPKGQVNSWVLAAAAIAGVHRVFCVGGAQAVAALAYGTETVPAVDKIVGPGNIYVATAKRMVFGRVGIDMIAGPSEILVISDGSAPAEWLAWDLLSQAEHDEIAQSIFISWDDAHIDAVVTAVDQALSVLDRAPIASKSWADRGAVIRVRDRAEACEVANRIAAEHLELAVADPESWLPDIHNAGAIFMGIHSCEALGDYVAGPNHVLPTGGSARFSSSLGVYDFVKRSSLIQASAAGANTLGQLAERLALGEGLTAHARSAACRVTDRQK
ncbi:histidinol dehydrogenase [Acidithiobacillus sp. HP-6]|uniref:histidinol dehydrogenase n=1 Tax=unclassified Acidithiobacillus TaxID=2614800 RepID=UPI00187A09DB|nr:MULTISPECIES: histidinol dehydrogenase [unclassified Acidithiobacillus]MBE7563522.1 histidinol dehydrogenase [Acidithiobacillus sp. HP-6]MBE7569982.1 histidinol dehydrogenase [Acidithiobacillus sp. HP-2]